MKKNRFLLLFACLVTLGFSSCTNNDHEWRDNNLAFIDKIKSREGIHEIGDAKNGMTGMYYEVLSEGSGTAKPIIGNTVKVSYQGWLFNDSINYTPKHPLIEDEAFDSSDNYEFRVGSTVIDGWNLAIQQMPVGSKWRIYIPYYLAYGSVAQTNIPAYSTLIFDIYLREIVKDN
jgi:FKBP-type peptidyl-prolyl cis-trans isomerase